MKAIMIMYDSLNLRRISPYGCDDVYTPNFDRLVKKSVKFNNAYVGSMPCMPARRELHTGRYNFLHRSWGPVEPYDDSMPEILRENNVYSHLITDHYHYFEDGGSTYHRRYNTWEIIRGQEADAWKGEVAEPDIPETLSNTGTNRNYWVNRKYMQGEENHSQTKTFNLGLEFLQNNYDEENWFLQLETFDPHEPYYVPDKYKQMYPDDYEGKHFDWPPYRFINDDDSEEAIEHVRHRNAALVSMCDYNLGRILDLMDEKDMWEDTMLIVNTDHGFMLGEHGSWAKCWAPFYNEVAHVPLFVWDPRTNQNNQSRDALVQSIDIAPTVLDFFGLDIPKDMQGKPLYKTILDDEPIREALLFGIFGGHVNCCDKRYVYMRGPVTGDNMPLYQYTLMPTRQGNDRAFIDIDELLTMELSEPFEFTKNCKTMKMVSKSNGEQWAFPTALYDLENDPEQLHPIDDPIIEKKMIEHMIRLMKENDCPKEQFERLGLQEN